MRYLLSLHKPFKQGAKRHQGIAVWSVLLLLSGLAGLVWYQGQSTQLSAMQHTLRSLALAQQALLAYAQQPLTSTQCEMNCPRPGDLPCPDRDNDGIAETSCSNTARLGRLPWKTLGIGDVRDGSGERLWYAVSIRYKNNPRLLPLNVETAGTWTVSNAQGLLWDATRGGGAAAVLIAPMQPLLRADGWQQQREASGSEVARHYLDIHAAGDNAAPAENTVNGFVMAPESGQFNDVVWPLTATRLHQHMQKQVLAELKRHLRCQTFPCSSFPAPAAFSDPGCLGYAALSAGQCLPAAAGPGRLPVDADGHWPQQAQHVLDGQSRHHWFQQNGWREQVLYQSGQGRAMVVLAGEPMPAQRRETTVDKTMLGAYVEAATLHYLQISAAGVLDIPSNDAIDQLGLP